MATIPVTYSGVDEVLRKEGRLISAVKGNSMLPMLDETKDTVSLVSVSGKLKKYDLPLYRRPDGQLVLHRIIKVRKKYYVTCGDNRTVSEKVPKEWVIAVSDGHFRNGGFISADDKEYKKYVRRRCRSRWRRKVIASPTSDFTSDEKHALAGLLRAAVTGKTDMLPDPEKVDMERVFRLARKQMISAAVSSAAMGLLTGEKYEALRENWQKASDVALRRDILTEAESAKVFAELDRLGIGYILLKGAVLKKLWGAPGMREYSDVDVLFDRNRKDDVRRVMEALGFEKHIESEVEDVYFKAPVMNFEMHKHLFRDESGFGGTLGADAIMERSLPAGDGTSRRVMSGEDEYVFTVAHLYKHWSAHGAGLRNYADIWLLKRHLLGNDAGVSEASLRDALKNAKLQKFESEAFAVCEAVFGDEPKQLTEKQMKPILSGGVYGTKVQNVRNGVAKKGKIGYFMFRAFPPVREISHTYPALKKAPVLLPFCWIHRGVDALLFKRSRISGEISAISHSGADSGSDD